MATKETRLERGRRRAATLAARTLKELREARVTAAVSQATIAQALRVSQAQYSRLEGNDVASLSLTRLCEIASVLGLEVALTLHPIGDPIRDRAQQVIGRRFDALLGPGWTVIDEALLPNPGDRRSWDKLLRLKDSEERHVVGVDLESRIYDVQALVRRTRERERDGGADEILIVLSSSAHNRRMAGELVQGLGPQYATPPAALRRALRLGQPLPGSGVILV